MGSTDLAKVRRRARVAYELGRLRLALLGIAPVFVVVAISVAASVGHRPWSTLGFGLAAIAAGGTMLWYGRGPQRAVLPGTAAGLVPLVLAICANHVHACGAHGCVSFCVPACMVGGGVAGLAVARVGNKRRAGIGFWLSASGLALLTGAMGCACVGYSGVAGLAIGFAAGVTPALVRRAFGVLGFLAVALPAQAAPPELSLPADATLTRLIEQSLAARPELARTESVVRAEQERVPQAGSLPDPMLQIGIQNDGFTSIEIGRMGTSFVSFMASQTFPWPGKLGLRRDVAELGSMQAAKQVARVRLATEAEVRRAYLDLLLVRDRLALLDKLDALWRNSLGVAHIAYEAGKGAQSDVLRAQLEIARAKQRRFALLGEERSRVQALNRLRNHPLDEPIPTSSGIRDLVAPATLEGRFSVERALARSPELETARLEITRTAKSVELAEKSYYPDLTVGAGIMVRGQLPPMWLATVGGPLPVFSRSKQSRAVAESRAWESAARNDVRAIEQAIRFRSEERHAAFSALIQATDIYNQGLLVQSEATADSTLTQYRVGKVTFASVLEANAGVIADQEGYLQALAAAHRIVIAEAEDSLAPTPLPGGSLGASGGMPGAQGDATPSM